MTIETKIETGASARARGFRYVRSDHVAVVSVVGERSEPTTPLRSVLQACFARFEPFLRAWLQAIPQARVLLFTATPLSEQHNALSRRRGLWALNDLRWLPESASRSPSVEVAGEHGKARFAGLAEIGDENVFDAADFARTHAGSFLSVSMSKDLTEGRVRSIVGKIFPKGESEVDWACAVAQVEEGADVCIIRASGGFDDREASLDVFLLDELRRRLNYAEGADEHVH